ncbi:MAG: hypothetical protein SGI74_10565 [Oligoflexia bacterium]|nr:hypothetical protein [Oligoflexia bacterium]
MAEKKIKLDYSGSKGWLIFWVIVFFPVALVLLVTGARFDLEGHTYFIRYEGSKNWLCFWTIAFFPIVFMLLLLNGVTLIVDNNSLSTGSHRLEA